MNKPIHRFYATIILIIVSLSTKAGEVHWDWNSIDYNYSALTQLFKQVVTQDPFYWGAASSAYQCEGTESHGGKLCQNNWTNDTTKPSVGTAAGNWQYYKEDVKNLKLLGLNSYRLSIEWSKIQPAEGIFDEDALQHYVDVVNELRRRNIEPMICLFHHTWPVWFDKKGAFEKSENIAYFSTYAEYVSKNLGDKVRYWLPFNEPEGYALEGYFRGNYPPGKKRHPDLENSYIPLPQWLIRLKAAGNFLRNCLWAHIAVSKIIKANNPDAVIGIVKVMNPIEPYHSYNPIEQLVTKIFGYLLNDTLLNFFATGSFNWLGLVKDSNTEASNSVDFIGISYYTHTLLKQSVTGSISQALRPEELALASDSGKALYAEGLYRSIKRVAAITKKPIIIAENGLSDANDTRRDEYIRRHLYATLKAMKEGCDVRGYFYWSLTDTANWNSGFDTKYGLYKVDFSDPTKKRTVRPSAVAFGLFLKTLTKDN